VSRSQESPLTAGGLANETAVFDFDGTLTTRDCFIPYLAALVGPVALSRALATAMTAAVVRPAAATRAAIKAQLVRRLLRGRTEGELSAVGVDVGHRVLRNSLRDAAVDRLAWHRCQGHSIVIVSASLRYYVEPVAHTLGVDAVLCTELAFDDGRSATGELIGDNCRGQEKVNRLLASGFGRSVRLWAYGDSPGDSELLAIADEAVWVRRGRLVRSSTGGSERA
jgi:HAD superfamily hydrolase (TIGR01490 family)